MKAISFFKYHLSNSVFSGIFCKPVFCKQSDEFFNEGDLKEDSFLPEVFLESLSHVESVKFPIIRTIVL